MKPALAGGILLILWIGVLVFWGDSKDFVPSVHEEKRETPCKVPGHPLWTDC